MPFRTIIITCLTFQKAPAKQYKNDTKSASYMSNTAQNIIDEQRREINKFK